MQSPKFGFYPSIVNVPSPDNQFAVSVFVDNYDASNDTLLACGNVEIIAVHMPVYGAGRLILKVVNPASEDTEAIVQYTSGGKKSTLTLQLNYAVSREPYRYTSSKNELEIDTRWLPVSGVQVIVDGNIVRSCKQLGHNAVFTIPPTATSLKISGRFFSKTVELTPTKADTQTDNYHKYELSLSYDKCALQIDVSTITESYLLIEGDFRCYLDLTIENKNKPVVLYNHVYFKKYKYLKFSINGKVQELLVIKPSCFPTSVNWIANQHKLKFNKDFGISSTAVINGVHKYILAEGSNEIVVDAKIIIQTLIVSEDLSNSVVFEKKFDMIIDGKETSLPILSVDTDKREFVLSGISKQVIEIKIKGFPPLAIQPGNTKIPLPYKLFHNKIKRGIILVEIESVFNCIASRKLFYITL